MWQDKNFSSRDPTTQILDLFRFYLIDDLYSLETTLFEWQLPFLSSGKDKKNGGCHFRVKSPLEKSRFRRQHMATEYLVPCRASLEKTTSKFDYHQLLVECLWKRISMAFGIRFCDSWQHVGWFSTFFFTNCSFELRVAMMRSIAMGVLAAHELDDHGPTPLVHILSFWLHPSQICAYPLHVHLASICNN